MPAVVVGPSNSANPADAPLLTVASQVAGATSAGMAAWIPYELLPIFLLSPDPLA